MAMVVGNRTRAGSGGFANNRSFDIPLPWYTDLKWYLSCDRWRPQIIWSTAHSNKN